jgi:AIPR protein
VDRITESILREFSDERELTREELSKQFEAFATFCVISQQYEGEFDPVELRTGGGNDLAIDAAALIINGDLVNDTEEITDLRARNNYVQAKIVIIQARSSSNFDGATITDLAANLCEGLFAPKTTLPMNEDIKAFKTLVDELYANSTAFRRGSPDLVIKYVTTGTWTNDPHLIAKLDGAKARLEELSLFRRVSFDGIGATELQELYRKARDTVEAQFQFRSQVLLPDIRGVEQSYIGIVSAQEYLPLITDDSGNVRKSLFYDNVRDFQDYNEVNRGIRETLQSPEQRGRFLILNNGVTVVARELIVVGSKFTLRDYQIVNGCQTSHVLFDERDNLESVYIPLRLIVTTDDEVASSVTAATNRQTQVSDEDLGALEAFQKLLESYFGAHPVEKKLYYERRSKQYSSVPGLEKTRITTRPQLVRAYAAMFLDEPWRAGRYYKELLRIRKQDIFNPAAVPEPYYVSAVAAYRVEYFFRNGYLHTKYKPARYQLLMALRHLIGGPELPKAKRELMRYCDRISEVLWDPQDGPSAVAKLLPVIDQAVQKVESDGVLDRDTVRTQIFTDHVITGVSTLG